MSDLNDVKVFGRVVRDAVMKETAGGMKVAEFDIATNITYRDENGEFVQKGNFFPLSIFGSYAEKMLSHLRKGRRLIVEGYLKQNRWTTSDGKNRSATTIGVRKIHLIFDGKKPDAAQNENQNQSENFADEDSQAFDFTGEQLESMYGSEPDGRDFFPDEEAYSDTDAIF